MAFKETYQRLVGEARDAGVPVSWSPSLGHDPAGREAALMAAVSKGRLSLEYARGIVPSLPAPAVDMLELVAPLKRLETT